MTKAEYLLLPFLIQTHDGQFAWKPEDLPAVMKSVADNSWIVLGGDVLTVCEKYTYDNWFYEPDPTISLAQNVDQSISLCLDYVEEYTQRKGVNFLFTLVLSDTFSKVV